jgi:GINS complex subunit 4
MDVDISDILADVSRTQPYNTAASSRGYSASDTDAFTDHQLLTRAWTSERCAPDLLPYPTDLMTRVMSRIQAQISRIEDLASGMGDDPGHSYTANGAARQGGTQNANLVLAILQTDLSRTQFLVRSLLRQRLAKVTKYAAYYLAQHLKSEIKTSPVLSESEVAFARHHQALLGDLYESSFLNAFPQALRRLDDSSGGVPMVEGPDGAKAVIVRCLSEGTWSNERDVDDTVDSGQVNGASVVLRMRRGEVWLVRWRDVKRGVERGEIEML